MCAEIRRALELALANHLDRRRAHEAGLTAATVGPVPHPRLELERLGQRHRHCVLEASRLHERDELVEQTLDLVATDGRVKYAQAP